MFNVVTSKRVSLQNLDGYKQRMLVMKINLRAVTIRVGCHLLTIIYTTVLLSNNYQF